HVFTERFVIDRGTAAPMECRGVVAEWDPRLRQLMVWDSTQAPIPIRNGLARLLSLAQANVRVIAPDVGGGFGPKIMMFYPEEVLVPYAAMQLGRPVKWIEDRRENFAAMNHEREQIHDAAIAVDQGGHILGVKTVFLYDSGAYIPYGIIVPIVASTTLPGPYKIPNYRCEFRAVFTNKTIVSPYRGPGRPHGVFVMERLMDRAARGSGIGPYEGCRVTVEPSGKVHAATSVGTQGQGHFTSFAQIIADALTVPVEDIVITTGDSGAFGWGTGTFASRAAVVAGNAVHLAAQARR